MRLALGLAAVLGIAFSLQAQFGRGYSGFWIDAGTSESIPGFWRYPNEAGALEVLQTDGDVNAVGHPFFRSQGTNGRACVTCHQPFWGMSVSSASLRDRWYATAGTDPVFAAVDGSNCPNLPQHILQSHSLTIDRGLFRIPLAPPPDAEFTIEVVSDPTGCNLSPAYGVGSANPALSVYRRPRPTANLRYVTAGEGNLMADGREPSLLSQARSAVVGHQQGGALSDEAAQRIVDYESQVYLATMTPGFGVEGISLGKRPDAALFRPSVSRGAEIFARREFSLKGVAHSTSVKLAERGTCASCHSTPLTGQAPSSGWVDVGTTNKPTWLGQDGLPVFKINCDRDAMPHPTLGREIYTTDPGRALISGKCADVGSIVMQQLRGLAARAPYFVNGSARTLRDVVDFYDQRFQMKLSAAEKADLVLFLEAL